MKKERIDSLQEESIQDMLKSQKKDQTQTPEDKLLELHHCGNERIELSAAKELIALKEAEQEKRRQEEEAEPLKIEVRIRIEQQEDGREDVKA